MYNLVSVVSSNVAAVGCDGNDLIVKFNDGSLYRYYGAAAHFNKITKADSVGKYLNENVKNKYRYEKIN